MRNLFMLVLFGFLQVIRAQENSSSITTNSAGVVTPPRIIKPLKSNAGTEPGGQTVHKGERPENAKRVALSFDPKAQSFAAYDRTVVATVQGRWCDLLDDIKYDGSSTGKVVLEFQLNYDGRITELKAVERSVGETLGLLCEKAVLEPTPFPRWPKEMHKQIAADSRKMTLTFYYLSDETHQKK